MTIFVEDSFDSAHFLPNVPDGHKCKNVHGHTYKIRIEISGPIGNDSGWVVDYADVKERWGDIKTQLDHKILNDIDGLVNSTCELVARWIWIRMAAFFGGLSKIELRETEHCGVVYLGEGQ